MMLGAAIKKDIQLLVRDRRALTMLFVMPVAFIVVFGMFFEFGPDEGKPREIAVWHAPGDARGERVVKMLVASGAFAPKLAASADAVRAEVAAEDTVAGLIIPPDFAPGTMPVELVIDEGMSLQVRGPLAGALIGIATRGALDLPGPDANAPAIVVARTPPGIDAPLAHISAFQITVPGNAVLFGFFIALSVAIGFTEERRSGTWRRSLAAPVPRATLLLSKLVPYSLVGLGQIAFLFAIGALAFGMQVAGSLVGLVLLSVAVVLCATALGLLLASFGRTEKQIGGIGPPILLVMGMLGGCMFPRLAMPEVMQTIGLGVPHGWALEGYYALLVRPGTTVVDVLPEIGAVLGFAVVFAAVGLSRFRFERA
jgi:ABC-2 type transport system permease protein